MILPIMFAVGMAIPSNPVIDLENSSSLDESELDDDFYVLLVLELAIATSLFSRFRAVHLDFQSSFFAPDSPPPK